MCLIQKLFILSTATSSVEIKQGWSTQSCSLEKHKQTNIEDWQWQCPSHFFIHYIRNPVLLKHSNSCTRSFLCIFAFCPCPFWRHNSIKPSAGTAKDYISLCSSPFQVRRKLVKQLFNRLAQISFHVSTDDTSMIKYPSYVSVCMCSSMFTNADEIKQLSWNDFICLLSSSIYTQCLLVSLSVTLAKYLGINLTAQKY